MQPELLLHCAGILLYEVLQMRFVNILPVYTTQCQ